MLSQSQSAQESILGLQHPDLANTYRRKGDILRRMYKYGEAEIYYKKAIEIYENGNIVAMNLDAFAMACASLSAIAFCHKDCGLAASYHSKAVRFLRTASSTSEILSKMNAMYNHYAEKLFKPESPELSLGLFQQSENHDRILDIALNYANQSIRAFSDKQRRLEALALKSKAVSAVKDCPMDSKQKLIALFVDAGKKKCENENDLALGVLLLQQGGIAIKELLGVWDLKLATCYDTMALALSKNGNTVGALKYFEKSMGILEAFGGHVPSWRFFVAHARISECKNDLQNALKFYEMSVTALKSTGAPEDDRYLAEGLSRIAVLAEQLRGSLI
jgi:tetratricopeptide (TPR) repeat protein